MGNNIQPNQTNTEYFQSLSISASKEKQILTIIVDDSVKAQPSIILVGQKSIFYDFSY